MQIADDTAVTINYTLKNDAGEVIDTSAGDEPLSYIHGQGNIVEGLEKALTGKGVGDKLNVKVSPDEGYGERDKSRVQQVPKEAFEDADQIKPGMRFQTHTEDGMAIVTVTAVSGDKVTIDANHPLAGETLHFEVEVMGVRKCTAEELAHGHIHGPGGHHHH